MSKESSLFAETTPTGLFIMRYTGFRDTVISMPAIPMTSPSVTFTEGSFTCFPLSDAPLFLISFPRTERVKEVTEQTYLSRRSVSLSFAMVRPLMRNADKKKSGSVTRSMNERL